jgi:hypothetical protein
MVTLSCSTTGETPLGPSGSGQVLSAVFKPLVNTTATATLTQTTSLADIQGSGVDHSNVSLSIQFSPRCADVTGNGAVTLLDALAVLPHIGQDSSTDPTWSTDAKYDLNRSLAITLLDVLYVIPQVGASCAFVP